MSKLRNLLLHLNAGSGNGILYLPSLPSLPRIHRCIVSIQASRIKKSSLYLEKMVKTDVSDKTNCPGGK